MKFVEISEIQKKITSPEIKKSLADASAKSPLGAVLTQQEFEQFLGSNAFGTGASVKMCDMISIAYSDLFNPTPGSIAGVIGTNRVDSNLKDVEIASRLGLYLDTFQKLKDGYYDPEIFSGESAEFSFTVYPFEVNGKQYYLLHDGGHRLFLLCQLIGGMHCQKVRRDGQHDKYINLYNKHFAGKSYETDEVMRDTVNEMLSYLPARIKLERDDFDMPIRNECKPYKNNESLHKSWASSKLYKFLFNLYQARNDVLKFVAKTKQGAFKFCNDLALVISLFFGYYVSDTKTATKSFYYDVNNFANDAQYARTCSAIERYLALYNNPDVYPFLRAYNKKTTPRYSRYIGYKDGTTMVNSNISVQMVLDSVYAEPSLRALYSNEFFAWKKKVQSEARAKAKEAEKRTGRSQKSIKLDLSFRSFFEINYLNTFDMTSAYVTPEKIFEARLVLAEHILSFFENNAAYFSECGNEICGQIANANITDGVGKPSKYKDIVATTKKHFGRKMQNFYANANSVAMPATNKCAVKKSASNKQKGVVSQ